MIVVSDEYLDLGIHIVGICTVMLCFCNALPREANHGCVGITHFQVKEVSSRGGILVPAMMLRLVRASLTKLHVGLSPVELMIRSFI